MHYSMKEWTVWNLNLFEIHLNRLNDFNVVKQVLMEVSFIIINTPTHERSHGLSLSVCLFVSLSVSLSLSLSLWLIIY